MSLQTMRDLLPQVQLDGNEGVQPLSGRQGALLDASWDYVTDGLHPCVLEAFLAVSRMAGDIVEKRQDCKRWVTLAGKSGSGKTHLARKMVDILRERGWSAGKVQFWYWGKAFERIMEDSAVMDWLIKRPVLVLDDIGASYIGSDRAAQLQAAKLLELLEGRLGKWTLLTSNLWARDIAEKLDPRIASRLKRGGSEVIDMRQAADYCWLMDRNNRK